MKRIVLIASLALAAAPTAFAAADDVDVEAVVTAVKAANPDLRSLCQGGPDRIRQAVTEKVRELVGAGKIKSNPQEVGGEAGKKIGQSCRG